jgi:peptide/nickel transport system ATP-binding protein
LKTGKEEMSIKENNEDSSKTVKAELELFQKDDEEIPIIKVDGLKTYFYTEEGIVKAVDGVTFEIFQDEIIGLVGETGCGKSVTALSILRLVRSPGKIVDGKIEFKGENLLDLPIDVMRQNRGSKITMIFQDPLNSLNPVISVGDQIGEVFTLHQMDEMKKILDDRKLIRKDKIKRIKELKNQLRDKDRLLTEEEINTVQEELQQLKQDTKTYPKMDNVIRDLSINIIKEVGIADAKDILSRYPFELSGGMRQRVMIAMALSCNPALLIADEPTTALDVTIQAQILDLMKDLKTRFNTSILMITHDLGIIAELCDRVAVMYSGNIVEYASAEDLFKNPLHPYTKGLIGAIPSIEKKNQELVTIRGMVPNLIYPPSGCRFHPRCDYRLEVCNKIRPRWQEISNRYFIACHLFDSEYKDSPKYKWEAEDNSRLV